MDSRPPRRAQEDATRRRARPAMPIVWACILVAALTGAGAVPALASDARLAVLATTVNDVPKGDAIVMVTETDVLVEAAALERAGIRHKAVTQQLEHRDFVSLRSLEPGVLFDIDRTELVLRLTVAPALLGSTVVQARRVSIDQPTRTPLSAFLNYSVNWRDLGGVDAFAEAGVTAGRVVATTTYFTRPSGGAVRGLTQAVIDDRQRLTRWTVGDRVVGSGELGGAILLGGVTAAREYGIDPGFVNFSTVNFAGTAAAPAIVEVYANGQLVDTHRLPAGQFELRGLPLSSGRGEAQIIVRDVFGRRQEYGAPYYVTTAVLAKGLHDFAYGAGVERDALGSESWTYGRPAAIARHRVGVTDSLTLGARAEVSGRRLSGGPSMNWRFPFGEIELGVAGSRDRQQGAGAAAVAGYRYVGRRLNVGAVFRSVGRSYRTLGSRYDTRFAVREADLSAAVRIGSAATVSLRRLQTSDRTPLGASRSSLSLTSRLAARTDIFVTVNHQGRGRRGAGVVVGLTRVLGKRTGSHVSYDAAPGRRSTAGAEIAQSVPVGRGLGYRLRWHDTPGEHASGMLEYQGDRGRYEASVGMAGSGSGAAAGASGALVAIGGRVHATRTIQDAYALVRVARTPGVRVYASQQEIGRTGRDGTLLIPNLLSYSSNELTIADSDVPMTSAIEATGRVIVPGYRAGAIVQFPVREARPTRGRIEVVTADGVMIPFAGQLTVSVAGRTLSSPIGRSGDFYFEELPRGAHAALVTWNGRRCAFRLQVDGAAPEDLGLVRCTVPGSGS